MHSKVYEISCICINEISTKKSREKNDEAIYAIFIFESSLILPPLLSW